MFFFFLLLFLFLIFFLIFLEVKASEAVRLACF